MKSASLEFTESPQDSARSSPLKLAHQKSFASNKAALKKLENESKHTLKSLKIDLSSARQSNDMSTLEAESLISKRRKSKLRENLQTLRIFRHSVRIKTNFLQSDTQTKKGIGHLHIKKDDSPDVIKQLMEKTHEECRSRRDKTNGRMYINELWNDNYEKKTMKAVNINGALLRLGKYETKRQKPSTKNMNVMKTESETQRQNLVFPVVLDSERIPCMSNPLKEEKQERERAGKSHKKVLTSQDILENILEPGYQGKKHSSVPKISDLQSGIDNKNLLTVKTSRKSSPPMSIEIFSLGLETKDLVLTPTKPTSTSKPLTPRMSNVVFKRPLISTKSEKNLRVKVDGLNEMSVMNTEMSTRKSTNYNTLSLSPLMAKEALKTRLFLQSKGQDIDELIEKCNTELENRSERVWNFERFHRASSTVKKDNADSKRSILIKF